MRVAIRVPVRLEADVVRYVDVPDGPDVSARAAAEWGGEVAHAAISALTQLPVALIPLHCVLEGPDGTHAPAIHVGGKRVA